MLDEYYDLRGWSSDGVPKGELPARFGFQEEGVNSTDRNPVPANTGDWRYISADTPG